MKLRWLVLAVLAPLTANADCPPEHAAMGHCRPDPVPGSTTEYKASPAPSIGVTVTVDVLAATYSSPLYEGSYQGTILGAGLSRGAYALSAQLGAYHLRRNGIADEGLGDLMLHAHVAFYEHEGIALGAMFMATAPTGDDMRGYGMGHPMLMPELWGSVRRSRVTVGATTGYGYMVGGAQAHANHGGGGAWPLIDPMNASELMFGANASYAVAAAVALGAHAEGGLPLGDGRVRIAAGGRIQWTIGSVHLTADLAAGLVNGPYGIRGMLGVLVPIL